MHPLLQESLEASCRKQNSIAVAPRETRAQSSSKVCVFVCMCSITQRLPYHANRSCGQNRKLFSLSDPHGKSRFSTTRPSKGPNPGSTNFAHGTKLSSGLLGPLFTSIVIQAMGLSSPIHIAVNMIGRHVRWHNSEILAQMDWK